MKFDLFLSICQTDVDGYMPSEKKMFENFFDQVRLADNLGYETAWVAETHLSCEVQKKNPNAVIPHFKGEIGLNTDILQMAHVIFGITENINVGSAIRNILCNGGPVAHAEEIKTAMSLKQHSNPEDERKIDIGFASGRFEFSNRPYGINPRNETEQRAWSAVKGKILHQATEVFLRLLNGEVISSQSIGKTFLTKEDFRKEEDFLKAGSPEGYEIKPFWDFEALGVIPKEAPLQNLNLTLGSHDPRLHELANRYRPVKVFNLSITPEKTINETHARMKECFHPEGGPWKREYMPRTAMVYLSKSRQTAKEMAQRSWENYWKAMEGTLDPQKVQQAVTNSISGDPAEVKELIKEKYHPEDRLMLWFDFNNHDNEMVKESMRLFASEIMPDLKH